MNTQNWMKWVGLSCMVIDHCLWWWLPESANLYWVRLPLKAGLPCFAFGIVQGFRYSHDKYRYGLKMFILGVITQPFWGAVGGFGLNVCFELVVGLACIACESRVRLSGLVVILAAYYVGVGPVMGLLCWSMYKFDKETEILVVTGLGVLFGCLYQPYWFGLGLYYPMRWMVDRFPAVSAGPRWFHYAIYPGHMLVLGILTPKIIGLG
jgi:hypothetical protein